MKSLLEIWKKRQNLIKQNEFTKAIQEMSKEHVKKKKRIKRTSKDQKKEENMKN